MMLPRIDLNVRDVHFYGGLALAAWGGWHLSPAVTCVAVGAVLAGVGYFMPGRAKGG